MSQVRLLWCYSGAVLALVAMAVADAYGSSYSPSHDTYAYHGHEPYVPVYTPPPPPHYHHHALQAYPHVPKPYVHLPDKHQLQPDVHSAYHSSLYHARLADYLPHPPAPVPIPQPHVVKHYEPEPLPPPKTPKLAKIRLPAEAKAPLAKPAADHPHGAPGYKEPSSPYAFEYSVADDYSRTAFNAQETSNGDAVHGSYSVALPDGRTQHVKYIADHHNGFVAEVTYEGVAVYPQHPPHRHYD